MLGFETIAALAAGAVLEHVDRLRRVLSFETKPAQLVEYQYETGKSTSGRSGSKLALLQGSQLAFEVGHAQVGGGEFAGTVQQFELETLQPM